LADEPGVIIENKMKTYDDKQECYFYKRCVSEKTDMEKTGYYQVGEQCEGCVTYRADTVTER